MRKKFISTYRRVAHLPNWPVCPPFTLPIRFNIKFNSNYSYYFLYLHFLKNGINNNSGINISSIQNTNKSKREEKNIFSNTKRKRKLINTDDSYID